MTTCLHAFQKCVRIVAFSRVLPLTLLEVIEMAQVLSVGVSIGLSLSPLFFSCVLGSGTFCVSVVITLDSSAF